MPRIAYNGLVLDTFARTLAREGEQAQRLSPQEALFLEQLMRRPDHVIDYDSLLMAVYPDTDQEPKDAKRALRIIAHRIRAKAALKLTRFGGAFLAFAGGLPDASHPRSLLA